MNEKLKLFLKKYCEKHGISEETALTHLVVQEYKKELEEKEYEEKNT